MAVSHVIIALLTAFILSCTVSSLVFRLSLDRTLLTQSRLHLFDFFKRGDSGSSSSDKNKIANDKAKIPVKLEKISNTQNRDWKKEQQLAEQAKKPKPILDKQPQAYNYNKANEFPNLYKGWIKADGDQIAKQMIAATKACLSKKEMFIEVLFDPVPNLDEVAFGTVFNQRHRLEVAANLKVPEYACRRGGASTLEWANIYWANRLVAGINSKNAVAISLSGEGCGGQFVPQLTNGMRIMTATEAKKTLIKPGDANLLVILSPCTEMHYKEGERLGKLLGAPVIALNSPFSFRYDIGGGDPWTLGYVMKRIPKGWIFRQAPGKFDAILEGPDYEITRVEQFASRPTLPQISRITQEQSAIKYGAAGNDRIFQGRL